MSLRVPALLGIAVLAGCRSTPTSEPAAGPWFEDIAVETGIRFTHRTGATGQFYMPEIMGSGCALLDYDGDGDLDVLLLQAAPPGVHLYRNDLAQTGKLHFAEVTAESGLRFGEYAMGAATGDFNGDGKIDLLLTGFGGNALFQNEGGRFREVTSESPGLALKGRWSTGASFFDYDRDGRQDLIILNYLDYSTKANQQCHAVTGEVTYCTPKAYPATASHLFHNEGGSFVEVSKAAGIDRAMGRGLGVAAFDANADGYADVFIANDASANHLWLNQKNGTFLQRGLESGVAYGEEGLAKAGMGVAVGDYDNSGTEDVLVLNLMREGATLFQNTGGGSFLDVSLRTGMHAITFPYTGFGTGWHDFDNDGWLDLFLANGAVVLREEQRGQPYPFRERNLLIRNPGPAKPTFEDATARAGAIFEQLEVSRGAAFGDIDKDGDVDILLANNNGPARLLRNNAPRQNWLEVGIEGPGLGIGARVSVKPKGLPELWRRVHTDASYLSASDTRVHFGLGQSAGIERVTIHWPDGSRREVTSGINKLLTIPGKP